MLSYWFLETKKLATNRLSELVPDISNITCDAPGLKEERPLKKKKIIDNDSSDTDEGNSVSWKSPFLNVKNTD